MSLTSLRREVAKLKQQIGADADVGPIPVIDPTTWSEEDHFAYLDVETEAERAAIYERAEGKPLVTHRNTRANGEPGVSAIYVHFDPREYATA
jgi:hypothetical protein